MDPDQLVMAAGLALILGMFAFMLRHHPVLVTLGEDGLGVGVQILPWGSITGLIYTRGSQGTFFRVSTPGGMTAFRDEQIVEDPMRMHNTIIARALLRPVLESAVPPGVDMLPGDIHEEWARDVPPAAAPLDTTTVAEGETEQHDPSKKAIGAGAIMVLLWKFGKLMLVGLGWLGKLFKLGSVLPTALTMLGSLWVYAQLWGWRIAAGFVGLILLHELGHVAVMAAKGMRTTPIVFVPFVGAFIGMKDQPRDATVEAEMAYGGPAAGALAATLCLVVYQVTGQAFWVHLAYIGFFLNLFNLLPISPLDGGRVVTAVSTWLWILGLVLAAALAVVIGHPILYIIVVLGALRAVRAWRAARDGHTAAYFQVSPAYRAGMAGAYFGLCAYLGYMMQLSLRLGNAHV